MSEMIKANATEISNSYREAVSLHHQIMANGEMAAAALVEMCRGLKRMRDAGLYIELGFASFEDYVEQAVGIKQRQAYKYISTYERLGDSTLKANASLGITKLELIASVPAEERVEFTEQNDLAGMSVKEIKAMAEELTIKGEQLNLLQEENERLKEQVGAEPVMVRDTEKEVQLESRIAELTELVAELQAKPADVAVIEPDEKTLDIIRKEAEKEAKEKAKVAVEKAKKEAEKAKADAIAKEEATRKEANDKINAILDEKRQIEAKLKQASAESEAAAERAKKLENELKLKSSAATTEVTVYFGQMQDAMNKIILKVNDIKKDDPDTGKKLAGAMVKFLEQTEPICRKLIED